MTVWLQSGARLQIEREARLFRLKETGGPLFGFDDEPTGEVVVIAAGGPGPKARHHCRTFEPDRDAVDRAIARVHEASEGRFGFLGSWHTHPMGRPLPSRTDVATARRIAADPDAFLPQPLLLIQATRPTRRTVHDRDLRAFRWSADDDAVAPLVIRRLDDAAAQLVDLDWSKVVA
jgi:integrative and conjugative element protein (TIGR02256 family)